MSRTAAPKRSGSRTAAPALSAGGQALARYIGAALAFGLIGAAIALGLNRLELHAQRLPGGPTRIAWASLPPWLSDATWAPVMEQLEAATGVTADVDVHFPRLCEVVAAKLANCAWIERVKRVAKRADGLIEIDATFRRPYAWVEQGGSAYLIDDAGAVLPRTQAAADVDAQRWLLIRGVQAKAPPVGQRWAGEDLEAGLKLAGFLYRAAEANSLQCRSDLRAIDVGNFKRQRDRMGAELRIQLASGNTVLEWGLPPGEEHTVQIPAVRKLGLIEGLYRAHGSLPGNSRVDLRWPSSPEVLPL